MHGASLAAAGVVASLLLGQAQNTVANAEQPFRCKFSVSTRRPGLPSLEYRPRKAKAISSHTAGFAKPLQISDPKVLGVSSAINVSSGRFPFERSCRSKTGEIPKARICQGNRRAEKLRFFIANIKTGG